MKKQRLALLLASVWMAAGIAHAEDYANPSWYVVGQAGALVPDANLKTGNAAFLGAKLGKQLSDRFDVQIGGTFSTEADVDYPAQYTGGSYKQSTLSLEALYLFSRGQIRPFLSAGAGVAFDDIEYVGNVSSDSGSASKTSFMGSLGAGVQYSFSKTGFLQADLSYKISKPEYKNGASVDINKIANLYAGIGVGFHFGEAPQAVAPVVEEPAPAPLVAVAGLNVCEDTGSCKKPEPEAKPVVKPVVVTPPPKQKVLSKTLRADASFANGSSVLTQKGKKSIDAAIASEGLTYATLSKMADLELLVVGHASRTGKETVNQKISLGRAESVKKYLVSKGIAADSIKTAGRGSSEPVTKGECDKLKAKKLANCLAVDRRVELFAQANVPAK